MSQELLLYFGKDCSDQNSHKECPIFVSKLEKYLEDDLVDQDFLNKMIDWITHDNNGSRYGSCCFTKKSYENIFQNVLKYLELQDDQLNKLILSSYSHAYYNSYNGGYSSSLKEANLKVIFNVLANNNTDKKRKLSDNIVNNILNKQLFGLIPIIQTNLININPTLLELMCTYLSKSSDVLNFIKYYVSQKNIITEEAFVTIIRYRHTELIDLFISNGVPITVKSLIAACGIQDGKIINRILDFKIIPTQKCFEELLTNCYLSYKVRESPNAKAIAELIDILINAGYKITEDDVIFALSKGCYINFVNERCSKIDDSFMSICSKYGYYPYDLKQNIDCLRAECDKSGNLQTIKKIIKENNLEPDIICLRNACKHKSNKQTIDYLTKNFNLIPDIECIDNLAKTNYNAALEYIISLYKQDLIDKQKKEKTIEQQIKDAVKKTKEIKRNSDIYKEFEKINEEHDKLINIKKTEKVINVKTKKIINNDTNKEDTNKENTNNDTNKENNDTKFIKLDEKQDFNKKIKHIPQKEVITLFKLKKNTEYGFFEVRSKLLEYIRENGLIDTENKNIIHLNENLSKIISLNEKDNYLQFENIDKYICHLFE